MLSLSEIGVLAPSDFPDLAELEVRQANLKCVHESAPYWGLALALEEPCCERSRATLWRLTGNSVLIQVRCA